MTPALINKIAIEQWGLRRRNGRPLSRNQTYDLFHNIFYAGQFYYQGEVHPGIHQPMITLVEKDAKKELEEEKQRIEPKLWQEAMIQKYYLRLDNSLVSDGPDLNRRPSPWQGDVLPLNYRRTHQFFKSISSFIRFYNFFSSFCFKTCIICFFID